jgi:hypothetical protein
VKDTHNGTRAQQQGQLESPKAPQPNGDGVVGSCPAAGRGIMLVQRGMKLLAFLAVRTRPRSAR